MLAYQIHNTAGKDEKFSWLSKTGKYTNTNTQIQATENVKMSTVIMISNGRKKWQSTEVNIKMKYKEM